MFFNMAEEQHKVVTKVFPDELWMVCMVKYLLLTFYYHHGDDIYCHGDDIYCNGDNILSIMIIGMPH